jgi:hypothetical protein
MGGSPPSAISENEPSAAMASKRPPISVTSVRPSGRNATDHGRFSPVDTV